MLKLGRRDDRESVDRKNRPGLGMNNSISGAFRRLTCANPKGPFSGLIGATTLLFLVGNVMPVQAQTGIDDQQKMAVMSVIGSLLLGDSKPELSLELQVHAGEPFRTVNDIVSYRYLVKNTGGTKLSGPVTVTDDKTAVSCPDITTTGNNDSLLDIGESLTCSSDYSIVQADVDLDSVTNTAHASAGGIDSDPGLLQDPRR